MSSSHTWIFCLVLSLFIHWQVLDLNWRPAVSQAGGGQSVEMEDCGRPGASAPALALRQLLEQGGEDAGQSGEDRLKSALARYLNAVGNAINLNKYTGLGPDKLAMIGNARYAFTIDAQGRFFAVRLAQSSGDPVLDRAAGNAVGIAGHKVKRPPSTGTAIIPVSVTVKYQYGL